MMQAAKKAKAGIESGNGHASAKPSRRASPSVAQSDAIIPDLRTSEGQTGLMNGRRFVAMHGHCVRYVRQWRNWIVWDGKRWALDESGTLAEARAKITATTIWKVAASELEVCDYKEQEALLRFAKYSSSIRGIRETLEMGKSEPGIAIDAKALNPDGWLLNLHNCTLNLQTGESYPHRREDLITKISPTTFDPAAECPLWDSSIRTFSVERQSIGGFLQRLAGYSLTGVIRDHVLAFLYGSGSNGKTTFLRTMMRVLGDDYAVKLAADTLMQNDGSNHPTGLTQLYGARLAVVMETEENKRLNERLVKELTGADDITARRMRENFWTFAPTFKLWCGTNHRLRIVGTDHAIWRRIIQIPFDAAISDDEADKDMPAKLERESSGILNWMIQGCRDWQEHGLGTPDEVKTAVAEYRADQDVLGAFLAERCILGAHLTCRASLLYESYSEWAKAAGEYIVSMRRFGNAMSERGFERFTNNGTIYRGVGLLTE